MSKIKLYQKTLKTKFQLIEDVYYEHLDDLNQILGNLDSGPKELPDYSLTQLSFVKEWNEGILSTEDVLGIFAYLNIEDAARNKLLKKLYAYAEKYEEYSDDIKPVIDKIKMDCLPAMIKYIQGLKKMFEHIALIEEKQIPISGFEQIIHEDGEIIVNTFEMPLSQTVNYLKSVIEPNRPEKFIINDNVLVFYENYTKEKAFNWILAPKEYIDILKNVFYINSKAVDSTQLIMLENLLKGIR